MNKAVFLGQLDRELKGIEKSEKAKFLSYYTEMIEDRMENGVSEEEAVQGVGIPKQIAGEILEEQGGKEGKHMALGTKILFGVLMVLGSPLWGSLLLAAVLLILSGYIVIWCLPFITGAVSLSAAVTAVISVVGSVILLFQNPISGVFQLGTGVFLAGIAILSGLLTFFLARIFVSVSKKVMIAIAGVFRNR